MISIKGIALVAFILIPSFLLAADPLFEPRMDYAAGSGNYVFGADLDSDGDVDLAVGGWGPLTVLKNNGDGSFSAPDSFGFGGLSGNIFGADLDGDSDIDVATTSFSSDKVYISFNNGDGSFQAQVSYSLQPTGDYPFSVFGGDLDGDGDVDLATANRFSQNISVLKNNGDGTFQPPSSYPGGNYNANHSIFGADLDGDADIDLVVGSRYEPGVYIFKNNGDGSYQPAVGYAPGGGGQISIFALELDGDGDKDLATANYWSNEVSVLMNNGDGAFPAAVDYPTDSGPQSVFGADLDLDGDQDLAAANSYGNNISILLNNGDGSFQAAVNYSVGSHPLSVFAADLDADGDPDLAVAIAGSDSVSIFMNLSVIVCTYKPGDADGSGSSPNLSDVIYIVNYIFKGGTVPYPLCRGDANESGGSANLTDLIYLINYVFKSGPAPVPTGRCCL